MARKRDGGSSEGDLSGFHNRPKEEGDDHHSARVDSDDGKVSKGGEGVAVLPKLLTTRVETGTTVEGT